MQRSPLRPEMSEPTRSEMETISMLEDLKLETVLDEARRFPPPAEFCKDAYINSLEQYEKMYNESIRDPEKFWARAAEELHWFKRWNRVLDDSNAPFFKWFVDGKTNLSYNCHRTCATRPLSSGRGNLATSVS